MSKYTILPPKQPKLLNINDFKIETRMQPPNAEGKRICLEEVWEKLQEIAQERMPTQLWFTWKEWGDDGGKKLGVSAEVKVRTQVQLRSQS